MGILSENQFNEPLHYGEVFSIWTILNAEKAKVAAYQTFINHAGDDELRTMLNDCIKNAQNQSQELEIILKVNGIALPPTPPERPEADLNSIPPGARFNDPEISATLQRDCASGLVACSTVIGQSTREDIAMMFSQFHTRRVQLGGRVLRMSKEKGWLIPPPLHQTQQEPVAQR